MSKYEVVISPEERHIRYQARQTRLIQAGAKVGLALYDFLKEFHDMHESKDYEGEGFSSFEEYTKSTLGIAKSQAYTYLKLYESFSKDFFISTGKIGVTKLELLAKLPEEEARYFVEQHDVDNISTKEIKRTLATYQDKKDEAPEQVVSEEPIVEIVKESIEVDSFGSFIRSRRLDKGYSLRDMASLLDMPFTTYRHTENGFRSLLGKKQSFYDGLIRILELSEAEVKEMYEWVDKDCIKRKKLAPDLVEFATENPIMNQILRTAMDRNASSSKLQNILKQLQAL